jgi:hypothetical protein
LNKSKNINKIINNITEKSLNSVDCTNVYEKKGKDIIFKLNELFKRKIINNNEQESSIKDFNYKKIYNDFINDIKNNIEKYYVKKVESEKTNDFIYNINDNIDINKNKIICEKPPVAIKVLTNHHLIEKNCKDRIFSFTKNKSI